jgi:WD40 repeat protein
VRTLLGHAHRINTLALNCDYVLRTGATSLDAMGAAKQSKSAAATAASEGAGADGALTNKQLLNIDKLAKRTIRKDAAESKSKGEDTGAKSSAVLAFVSEEVRLQRQDAALARYTAVVGNSGNGELLVSGSDDFTLILWAPQQGKAPIVRLTGHQQMINHVLFSPDARYFASASFDKKVKIWDGKTGKFLNTCHGHVGSVYQLAWSADSSFLVSASKDSTLKVWNLKGGDLKKAMHTLAGHEDEVYALDWSPDGSVLASGSKDRTIKIWHH